MNRFLRRFFNVLAIYCVLVLIATLWLWARSSGQVDVIGITREVLPSDATWPDRFSCLRIGKGMVLIQRVGNDQDPWGMYKDNVPDQAHDRDVAGGHVFHVIYPFNTSSGAAGAMLGYVDRSGLDHQITHTDRPDFQHPRTTWTEAAEVWAVPLWMIAFLSLVIPGIWVALFVRKRRLAKA